MADKDFEPFKLNVADVELAREMFDASPDGKAERRRIEALLDSLPRGTIELRGEWIGPDD